MFAGVLVAVLSIGLLGCSSPMNPDDASGSSSEPTGISSTAVPAPPVDIAVPACSDQQCIMAFVLSTDFNLATGMPVGTSLIVGPNDTLGVVELRVLEDYVERSREVLLPYGPAVIVEILENPIEDN